MNFAYFVGQAGVEQNAFCCSGFTGIHVGTDSNVAIALDWCLACHGNILDAGITDALSESEVREGLIGFCHTVHVFTLLHRITLAL